MLTLKRVLVKQKQHCIQKSAYYETDLLGFGTGVTGSLIIAEYCLFVCSLQVVRILEFLHGRCDVNLQFNKQARNIKLLFNHM